MTEIEKLNNSAIEMKSQEVSLEQDAGKK